MADYRVLVTGSREWADRWLIEDTLDRLLLQQAASGLFIVVHGKCDTGADAIAHRWAEYSVGWVNPEPHPARWRLLGKAAGYIRNQEMVNLGADICLAFFWNGAANSGTADCAVRAEQAGIPVKRFFGGP